MNKKLIVLAILFTLTFSQAPVQAEKSANKTGETILSVFDKKLGKDRVAPAQFKKLFVYCSYPYKCRTAYRQGKDTVILWTGTMTDGLRLNKVIKRGKKDVRMEIAEFHISRHRPDLNKGSLTDYIWKPARRSKAVPDIYLKDFSVFRNFSASCRAGINGCFSNKGFLKSLYSNVASNRAHRTAARMITRLLKK